jgi:hypothetical protein
MGRTSVGRGLASQAAVVTLAVFLLPASARADRHTADFGGGGTRAARSNLTGIVLAGGWNPHDGNWPCPTLDGKGGHACTLGLAGEISTVSGDHKEGEQSGVLSQFTFQIGPRFTYNKLFGHRLQLYLVGLAGFTTEQHFRDKTSFSVAGGLGADVPFYHRDQYELVVRVQQTWNWIDNNASNDKYGQTSVGLLVRFEKPPFDPARSSARKP